jgi:predicted Zn-dependent protease
MPPSPASLGLLDAAVARVAQATPSGLRLYLVRIDHLLALGRADNAFAAVGALVAAHPDSGDAWLRYAAAAEATGRAHEADRVLARLTDAWTAGSADWWAGMHRRLALRAASTRPAAACRLWDEITARADPPPAARRAQLQELLEQAGCPVESRQRGATTRPGDANSSRDPLAAVAVSPAHPFPNTQAGEFQPCV